MKSITSETPRKQIVVGGIILSAPTPFAEGDVLTGAEAAAINQTYLENVGNNFRAKVLDTKRRHIIGKENPTPAEIKAVTDDQIKDLDKKIDAKEVTLPDLQSDFDALILTYQMGVRRTSSVQVYTPEEKAARDIAKGKLKDALVKKGIKLNTVKAEWWEREIAKLLEHPTHGPKIKQTAKRQVALLQQAAAEGLDELDLTDSTKAPEQPAVTGAATTSE